MRALLDTPILLRDARYPYARKAPSFKAGRMSIFLHENVSGSYAVLSTEHPLLTGLRRLSIVLGLAYMPLGQSFDFGDFMNPSKWMGGSKKYEDDWYDYGPGPYGPPPAGMAPYGVPYAPPPSYSVPYGYADGTPGYYPGAPGFRSAPPSVSKESSRSYNVKSAEIEALKRRIEELEAKQQRSSYTPPSPPPTEHWTPSTDRWTGSTTGTKPYWSSPQKADTQTAAPTWDAKTNTDTSWGAAPAFRPLDKY